MRLDQEILNNFGGVGKNDLNKLINSYLSDNEDIDKSL